MSEATSLETMRVMLEFNDMLHAAETQRDELLEALKLSIKEFDGYTIHHISTIHGFSAANRIESTRAAISKAECKV